MTPKEKEALEKARAAGVPFPAFYPMPYALGFRSIVVGQTIYDFTWAEKFPGWDENGFASDEDRKKIEEFFSKHNMLYFVSHRGRRFQGFYLTKEKAEKAVEEFNIRHFTVAAMSDNPKYPVLI